MDLREEIRNQAMREEYLREAIRGAIERIKSLRPDLVLGITSEEKTKLEGFQRIELAQNFQDWVVWAFTEIKKIQKGASVADDLIVGVAEAWKNEQKGTSENK